MIKDDEKFIAPNLIGYVELNNEEKKKVKSINKDGSDKLSDIIIAFILMIICTLIDIDNIVLLICFVVYLVIRIIPFNSDVKYKASAYGKVVKKEVIYQVVSAKSNDKLKPYERIQIDKDVGIKKQPFYYLTVKLETGQFVRYVNCIDIDFKNLDINDNVLVIYFGDERVCGYKI